MGDERDVAKTAQRMPVAPTDVVIRGGDMQDWKLQQNAEEHHKSPRTPDGEWALSVATFPGLTELEIVEANPSIRQKVYRRTTGALLEPSFVAVRDRGNHGLILLENWPNAETCEALRALFTDELENPHYKERRRRRNAK